MPSFDIVSEVVWYEVGNAIDQANREIKNRYDFKGSDAQIEQAEAVLTILADDEYKVGQALDILEIKLAKRGVDVGCLDRGLVEERGAGKAQQKIQIRHGIDTELARSLVKEIKAQKLKVQAAIQGQQIRVTGKKRDDLQTVISLLKDQDTEVPLQYTNFRD
ncbi:MAG: YajQ family cyclic di-GMP-binding protein [Pseudomonadota bacterium]|nr:YajQ family cyclic di-GMP-binding protein [Pseudomonadota bacterium]MEE3280452.1 YajQ family cyclic di-GMP-binding protein [Pseudomonadota bacterium]